MQLQVGTMPMQVSQPEVLNRTHNIRAAMFSAVVHKISGSVFRAEQCI